MVLLVALFVGAVACGVGVAVGRRRGPVLGVLAGVGVLGTAALGLIAVLAVSLPM